jgi:HlyD family secretion protein
MALPRRPKLWQRPGPWLALVGALALLAALGSWQRQRQATARDVTPYTVYARIGSLPGVINASGELDAIERVNVRPS